MATSGRPWERAGRTIAPPCARHFARRRGLVYHLGMPDHLEAIVGLFVKKAKRDRIRELAAKPGRRADLRNDLLHDTRSLDPSVLVALPAHGTSADGVVKRLRAAGAGDRAYCITDVTDADDRELPLVDAVTAVLGRSVDSLVFPIGSRVAYYENHEGEQYLLVRK
jgi:hypothetical protein